MTHPIHVCLEHKITMHTMRNLGVHCIQHHDMPCLEALDNGIVVNIGDCNPQANDFRKCSSPHDRKATELEIKNAEQLRLKMHLRLLKKVLGLTVGSLQYKERGNGIYHVTYKNGKHIWKHLGQLDQLQECIRVYQMFRGYPSLSKLRGLQYYRWSEILEFIATWRLARSNMTFVAYREVKFPRETVKTLNGDVVAHPDKDFIIIDVNGDLDTISKGAFGRIYDVIGEEMHKVRREEILTSMFIESAVKRFRVCFPEAFKETSK